MGPKTEELVEVLSQLIAILEEDGQDNWASYMAQAKSWIVNSDFSGVQKVLVAYGGMGSFNDVCLRKITPTNCSFSELSTRAWQLATEIKHDYESST